MTILVTGATGFVGGWLLRCAKKRFAGTDIEVIVLSSKEIEGFRTVLHRDYQFKASDFADAGISRIDAVIHLGAFVGRSAEEKESARLNLTTVKNTEYLLAHLPNLPALFVQGSSIDVYGITPGHNPFDPEISETIDESWTPAPVSNYAMAKLFSEKLVLEWAGENGVTAHILRLGNQYGPGDRRRFFINVMAEEAAAGRPLTLTAPPEMIRNYIHVEDTCDFILRSLAVKENVGPVNLVSSRNPTMLEIAQELRTLSDNRSELHISPTEGYYGKNIVYDSKKRKAILGQERHTLENGLRTYYESLKQSG